VYVAKVESDRSIRLSTNVGGRKPTYCTGVGKALLAFAGTDVVREVVATRSTTRSTRSTCAASPRPSSTTPTLWSRR
jgi:DNA-binding IclR family transcriptional regulator